MDVLRKRIARALWDSERERGIVVATWNEVREVPAASAFLNDADAVIAALGLVERRVSELDPGDCTPHRMFVTPWERIEEGK